MITDTLPLLPPAVAASKTFSNSSSLEQFRRRQREFIKLLTSAPGGESPWRKFEWWVEMAYCSLAEPVAVALHEPARVEAFHSRYMRLREIAGRSCEPFPEMLSVMTMAMEESGGRDFLSAVASDDEINALNKGAGQFFTPFDVSHMMASMIMGDVSQLVEERGYITMSEPCSGAGGMLLAAAKVFRDQGFNPTTQLWVEAGDVATLCHQMTFIQATLAGISGRIVQQNALTLGTPTASDLTFGAVMFIARRGVPNLHASPRPAPVAEVPFSLAAEVAVSVPQQADLFGG